MNGRKCLLMSVTDAESYLLNWTTIGRLVKVVVILIDLVIGQKIKKREINESVDLSIGDCIFTIIALAIVSPCLGTCGFNVCLTISLLVGFTWGLLNEIRIQIAYK